MTTLPLVSPEDSIRQAMSTINQDGRGVAIVLDSHGQLLFTITDGDIRRAILEGRSLDTLLMDLLGTLPVPVHASRAMCRTSLLALMHRKGVRQIPLLDADGRVVDLFTMDDSRPVQAVVMAGGYGMRLRPLTDTTPKPMLPVNGRPLLEHTLERLRDAGVMHVTITTHYMPEAITGYFGDGSALGLDITYLHEENPLGTAGALSGINACGPVLVLNGDVLSACDYRALLAYHQEQGADLTVGVLRYELTVPYGVLTVDGSRVTGLEEKPTVALCFNGGVYVVNERARRLVPQDEPCHMTELIERLLADCQRVAAFPLVERWVDVGSPETYRAAQEGEDDAKA